MFRQAILAALIAAPAAADYSGNPVAQAFRDAPCQNVLAIIDGESGVVDMAAAFGFLVGFDQSRGGLDDLDTTTLERLTRECAKTPKRPALDILRSF